MLIGSEKQIAWATDLMNSAISTLETEGRKMANEKAPTEVARIQANKVVDMHINRISSAEHAADVIDAFKDINFAASKKSEVLNKIFYVMDYNKITPCRF